MARTSARSASQDIPSSPPKRESPIRRVTRSARHQSVDLDEPRNNGRSVERAGSENERRISQGSRRIALKSDLSILAEDSEISPGEDDEVEKEEDDDDEDEEDPEATKVADFQGYDLEHDDRSNSSGETLITSHTVRVMQEIDSISAIETLPDLYDTSCKIVNKSTKKNVRPKEMGRHLRSLKTLFDTLEVNREPYGGEIFIEVDIVKKKLSESIHSVYHNSEGLGDKAIPVTAILQSANLATLIGLVDQLREDIQYFEEELKVFLQTLEKTFPRPFVSEFAGPLDEDSENSKLINESFDMVLDIRTQLFITASHQLETDPGFDPDHMLTLYFLSSADREEICGVDFKVIGLKGQRKRTDDRIDLIRDTFMPADEATGPGEYIDFDRLEVLFPRSEFFNNLVGYGQDRMVEVEKIVDSRGGIENVMEPLKDLVKDLASDGEPSLNVDYKQDVVDRGDSSISKNKASSPPPRKSRKEPHADLKAILKLMKFRRQGDGRGSSKPDSSTNVTSTIRGPSRIQSGAQQEESEITRNFKKFKSSQNKENRRPEQHQESRGAKVPTDTSRRAMYRKHPNGEKVEWNEDSQGFLIDSQPRNNKRKDPLPPDDEAGSSDQGFQTDQRAAEPTARPRRVRADDEVLLQPINNKRKAPAPPAVQTNDKGAPSQRNNKRKASSSPAVEPEDEDYSSDQGFQNHQKLSRPIARPTKRARTEAGESPRAQNSNGNRSREVHSPLVVDDNDDVDEVQNQFALVPQYQRRREQSRSYQVRRMSPGRSRGRSMANQDDDEGSLQLPADEHSDETSFAFTQATARANARAQAAKTGLSKAQTRTEWSDGDTQLLIDYISGIGPMWAEIERRGEFERANISQVGLKDKARNIKVSMLLAGQKLPRNFEGVKLNVNLIKRVKTTWPNYDPYTETGYGAF